MQTSALKEASEIVEQRFHFAPSFGPYVRFLRDKMERTPDIRAKFYKYIISKFNRHPEFLQPFHNTGLLHQHPDLVQMLRMSLIPLAANSKDFAMALAFLEPNILFYYTDLFKKLLIDENIDFKSSDDQAATLRFFIKLILERCYKINYVHNKKMIKPVLNREQHLIRHHQIVIDSQYLEVEPLNDLPPFNRKWIDLLNVSNVE